MCKYEFKTQKCTIILGKKEVNYKALSKSVTKFLGVPATSGPVERVFSQGGRILRADHCKILHKNFEQLVFLKVNNSNNFEEFDWNKFRNIID